MQVRVDQPDEKTDVTNNSSNDLLSSDVKSLQKSPNDKYLTVSSTASTRLNSRKNSTEENELNLSSTG